MPKHTGPGQTANDGTTAAERRADYVRALKEERVGYVRDGKKDRVAQVDAELKRVQGRKAPAKDEA